MSASRTLQRQWLRQILRQDLAAEPVGAVGGLADFQASAVSVLEGALDRFGGAILADEVGMGKTHVALALLARRRPAVVVAPSSLRGMWRRALEGAGLGEEVAFVSHARLSRGELGVEGERARFIVVDEAHAFVHPETRRYQRLAGWTGRAPVLLMTATPVGLSLSGLVALVRLFCPPGSLVPLLGDTLERCAFEGARDLSPLLRSVVVRRPRGWLRRLHPRGVGLVGEDGGVVRLDFPRRVVVQLRYGFEVGSGGVLPRLLEGIESLDEGLIEAPAPLLRAMLLARLESSPEALDRSLARLEGFLVRRAEASAAGRRLDRGEWRRLFGALQADDDRQGVFPFVYEEARPGREVDGASLGRALAQVRQLRSDLGPLLRHGRKMLKLLGFLEAEVPLGEKVLIFSRFVETAEAVFEALVRAWPSAGVALVHGQGARVGGGAGGREVRRADVLDAFAPQAVGAREPPPSGQLRFLVATDVLAEGLNLQECPTIVSYDLPFNPRALIQRHGRNDRLGAPGRTVRSVILLPGRELEPLLGVLERVVARVGVAESVLGPAAPLVGLLPQEIDTRWLREALREDGDPLQDVPVSAFERGVELLAHADLVRLERRLPQGPCGPLPHGFWMQATPRHVAGTLFILRTGVVRDGLRLVFVGEDLEVVAQRHVLYPRLRALDTRLAEPLSAPSPAHLRVALTWAVQLRQQLRAAMLRPLQAPPASALHRLLVRLAAMPPPQPWETAALAQLDRLHATLRRPLPVHVHALIRHHLDRETPLEQWLPELVAAVPEPAHGGVIEEEVSVVGFVVFSVERPMIRGAPAVGRGWMAVGAGAG